MGKGGQGGGRRGPTPAHDRRIRPNGVSKKAEGTRPGVEVRKISCNDVQLVQNLIERCLQLYMDKKEVVSTLHAQASIEPGFTSLVWQKLEEQNPEFFREYSIRLKLKEQIALFNHLLEQQALAMKIKTQQQQQHAGGGGTWMQTLDHCDGTVPHPNMSNFAPGGRQSGLSPTGNPAGPISGTHHSSSCFPSPHHPHQNVTSGVNGGVNHSSNVPAYLSSALDVGGITMTPPDLLNPTTTSPFPNSSSTGMGSGQGGGGGGAGGGINSIHTTFHSNNGVVGTGKINGGGNGAHATHHLVNTSSATTNSNNNMIDNAFRLSRTMSFEEMSLALNSHLAEDDANELELFGVVDPGDKNDAIKFNEMGVAEDRGEYDLPRNFSLRDLLNNQ